MSQLYFTSSQIPSQQFLSFEDLFKQVNPEDILLVFDTNIVVYYRDFFLSPSHFASSKPDILNSIEYLVDGISKYNLEVNSSIGNDESSRSKFDFSLNANKARQTQQAMSYMFAMNKEMFKFHISSSFKQSSILINQDLAQSKIQCLKQVSTFSGILTLSYACVLKIFLLFNELENKKINRRKAYLDFLEFCMEEADGVAVTILSFAYHLFGGVGAFRSMILTKGKAAPEEKLHQLFNGSLDLIYPYITNKAQDFFPIPNSPKLVPILVTGDRRLSMLHSICNTNILLDADKVLIAEDLPIAQIAFYDGEKLHWTDDDKKAFKERTLRDLQKRYASATGPQKTTDHLFPIIEKLEAEVWQIFQK